MRLNSNLEEEQTVVGDPNRPYFYLTENPQCAYNGNNSLHTSTTATTGLNNETTSSTVSSVMNSGTTRLS